MAGEVTVVETLADADPEYTLTVEVTDGCLTSQEDLVIKVRQPIVGGG